MSRLTVKDITTSMTLLQNTRKTLVDTHTAIIEDDYKVYMGYLKKLGEDKETAISKLETRIRKLFNGIVVDIHIDHYELEVTFIDKTLLIFTNNGYSFRGINEDLAESIISLYTNEIGKPIKEPEWRAIDLHKSF